MRFSGMNQLVKEGDDGGTRDKKKVGQSELGSMSCRAQALL